MFKETIIQLMFVELINTNSKNISDLKIQIKKENLNH